MRVLILLFCLHAAPLSAAPRAAIRLPAGLTIATITIETHNVFDTDKPPENKLLYRAANKVRIQTRDYVVRNELLFAVGDPYDAALVAETERNLRLLPFIRRAEAEATVNKSGTVDVVVRTYDAWTLELVASFKRAGGVVSAKAGIAEHDLLGQGKTISAVYNRDGGSASQSFGWKDPQFLGQSHLSYAMAANSAPGSRDFTLSLNRPFYASVARSALGGTVTYVENNAATFSGSTAIGSVHKRAAEAGLNYGVALATSTERTRRVKIGVLAHRADYRPIAGQPTGPMPLREQSGFLLLGADWEELDYITVRRIQKFTHDEDFNLGLAVYPALAWAPSVPAFGTSAPQILPSVTVRKGFILSNQLLLLSSGYKSQYVNGGNGNRVASFDATYFVRGLRFQTLAFHSGLDLGWRLDPGAQMSLGEANGLRGYGLSQFSGNRRLLFNIEDRIYVWDELFRLLDVGMVVFGDSGYAWPSSSSMKASDLKNSVGLGLRVAPSRSSTNSPVRIDLARALGENGTRSRWSLSILAGQAF